MAEETKKEVKEQEQSTQMDNTTIEVEKVDFFDLPIVQGVIKVLKIGLVILGVGVGLAVAEQVGEAIGGKKATDEFGNDLLNDLNAAVENKDDDQQQETTEV